MALIFISYSSRDSDVAIKMQDFFTNYFGLTSDEVFLAEHSIRAGEQGDREILNAIKTADFLIYIISEDFFKSPYCMCELGASWATGKIPYKFIMEPLHDRDERYLGLPLAIQDTQYVKILNGTKARIKFFLQNIIQQIKIQKDLEVFDVNNDRLINFVNYLSLRTIYDKQLDLRNVVTFHHPEDGFSIVSVNSSENTLTMLVDYSNTKPLFAGCAIKLSGESWTNHYREDHYLHFSVSTSAPLNKIVVELKDIDTVMFKKEIDVSTKEEKISINLQDMNVEQRFRNMQELVFLLPSTTLSTKSKINIKDVYIGKH